MDKLKILCCPANDGGCSYYRAWAPFAKLQEQFPDLIELRFNKNPLGINEKEMSFDPEWGHDDIKWADIVMTQNIANWGGPYTARVIGIAREYGKFVHYDTDDLLTNLYEGHRLKQLYKEKGLEEITKFIYQNSDLVVCSQSKRVLWRSACCRKECD